MARATQPAIRATVPSVPLPTPPTPQPRARRAAFPALAPVSFYIIDATVHLHHFFAGGLLAFVLHRRAEHGRPAVPYAASISLVAFVAICCTPALPDTGPYNRSSLFKQVGGASNARKVTLGVTLGVTFEVGVIAL